MATYVSLFTFTDEGIRNVRDTVKRANAFREVAAKAGVTVREIFWTMGQYDLVGIVEAKDDTAALALLLGVGAMGNIKTQTLRAYSADEIEHVLTMMPKT